MVGLCCVWVVLGLGFGLRFGLGFGLGWVGLCWAVCVKGFTVPMFQVIRVTEFYKIH